MTGKQWTAAAVIAVAGFAAGPALAYILPADAILSGSISRRVGLGIDTLVLEGLHTLDGESVPMWAAVKAGRAFRVQTKRDAATEVNLVVGDRRWRFSLGSAAGTPQRVPDEVVLQFVLPNKKDPGAKKSLAFLKKNGVDTEVVSMSRFDGRTAYVIGAKPWEGNKPQLWIDKGLRVPLRFIHVDKATNMVHEQRLLGYGTEVVDQWFPRVIERLENGKVVERLEFRKVDVNADVDADLLVAPK